jgi:transposase
MQRSMFMRVRALYEAGHNAKAIAGELGLGRRRVDRWIRLEELPERQTMAAKFCTPAYFREYLSRRWAEGCTHAGRLFEEIQRLGYSGSYSHLARLLSPWRHAAGPEPTTPTQRPTGTMLVDPETNRTISPLVAAALCVRPRKMLTARQAAKVDALKAASHEFATMRALAMRFRGLLRAGSRRKLERWIKDALQSGIYAMQRFARTLRQDIGAVRNAVTVSWSNGPTEGHINRLKTLKRAMYGRAGVELLRARVLPPPTSCLHRT